MFSVFKKLLGKKPQITPDHVKAALHEIAAFADKHDLIVPEVTVKVGAVELSITFKKLEDNPS